MPKMSELRKARAKVTKAELANQPTMEELEMWSSDCGCEATDGCWVEPGGICEHGKPSWLLYYGMI